MESISQKETQENQTVENNVPKQDSGSEPMNLIEKLQTNSEEKENNQLENHSDVVDEEKKNPFLLEKEKSPSKDYRASEQGSPQKNINSSEEGNKDQEQKENIEIKESVQDDTTAKGNKNEQSSNQEAQNEVEQIPEIGASKQEESKTDISRAQETDERKEANEKSEEKKPKKAQKEEKLTKKNSPNLFFYKNELRSRPDGVLVEKILTDWRGNYRELERNHSYIQWLFPNFYQSAFNSDASPLTEDEAEIFRTNKQIAERLVRAYNLILDFFGIEIADQKTGKLKRTSGYETRYNYSFLTYYHNHLRMRRILTHLNNVGFRRYAIELVNFLEKEIYGQKNGYELFTSKSDDFDKKAFENAPLKKLAKLYGAFPTWVLYGDHKDNPEKIELLEKNCFAKYPEGFQDSIYFSQE